MLSFRDRSRSTLCWAVVLLCIGFVWSCTEPPAPGLKDELVYSLGGEDLTGFDFSTEEDESQTVASLTNGALREYVNVDKTSELALKYTLVKDKKTGATNTYKTEILKSGAELTLAAKDIATGEVVHRTAFPVPEQVELPEGPATFDTLQECIADFNCTEAPALQCEANRTCEDQAAGILCCLNNGQCISVHFLIRPTELRCRLRVALPDRGVFLASQ